MEGKPSPGCPEKALLRKRPTTPPIFWLFVLLTIGLEGDLLKLDKRIFRMVASEYTQQSGKKAFFRSRLLKGAILLKQAN